VATGVKYIYKTVCCSATGKCCPYVAESKEEYQLVYFPIRGRAEVPRLILEEAGAPYKSVAVSDDDMKPLKASGDLAFGQVPLLRHGNFKLVQSNAIIRYLGRQLGRYGKTAKDRAFIDMVLDGAEDLRMKYLKMIYGDEDFETAKARYLDEVAKVWLGYFETILLKNNGGHGFLVGDQLSVADLSLYEEVDKQGRLFPNLVSAYPLLKAWKTRVETIPRIAAYLASGRRPAFVNGNDRG